MPIINISVKNKIATAECGATIVCKNSDYVVRFDFDEQWNDFVVKTAKFAYDSTFIPVVFVGNECAVPKLPNTYMCAVEVQAGNLRTASPAFIDCLPVLDDSYGEIEPPAPDVYDQIMQMLKDGVLTGAKIVETVYIGKDENGGNVYKQIFDNGTENYFTAPKGLDAELIIGEDVGTAYDGAKGAKNARDILALLGEVTKIYQSIRKNSENISENHKDANDKLGKKLDKSNNIANGNLIKYNSQYQKIEDAGISSADIEKNTKDIKTQSEKLSRESVRISQNATDIRNLNISFERDSAIILQNQTDIENIRVFLDELTERLNAILNSDDETLDQLAEIVAYIKSNKSLIDSITTSKVNVSDIIDSLGSDSINKPLSANQGRLLRLSIAALASRVDDFSLENGEGKNSVQIKGGKATAPNSIGLSQIAPNYFDYSEEKPIEVGSIVQGITINMDAFNSLQSYDDSTEAEIKFSDGDTLHVRRFNIHMDSGRLDADSGTPNFSDTMHFYGDVTVTSISSLTITGIIFNGDGTQERKEFSIFEFLNIEGKELIGGAKAKNSFTAGYGTTATRIGQAVVGLTNETDDDALLIVGNGQPNSPSNAMVVKENGDIYGGYRGKEKVAFSKEVEKVANNLAEYNIENGSGEGSLQIKGGNAQGKNSTDLSESVEFTRLGNQYTTEYLQTNFDWGLSAEDKRRLFPVKRVVFKNQPSMDNSIYGMGVIFFGDGSYVVPADSSLEWVYYSAEGDRLIAKGDYPSDDTENDFVDVDTYIDVIEYFTYEEYGDEVVERNIFDDLVGIHGVINEKTGALADNTFTAGKGTKATKKGQTALGEFNETDDDALVIVGNGTEEAPSNAFVVKKDGEIYAGERAERRLLFADELGDISTALDELHAYAQNLVSGVSE